MEKGKGVMGEGRRWAVDLTDNSTSPYSRDFPDPPGFSRASLEQHDSTVSRQKKVAESTWKAQKAWEVAQAPFKNLMMMGFMMWMAGSTVHLFSIGITLSSYEWFSITSKNVSDITFSNIHMSTRYYDQSWWGRAEPIYVTTCPQHSKSKEGSISNLLFVNITSTSENGVFLSGSKGGLLSDLRFINLDPTYRRWTNNAGGLVDYRPGCQGLVKHITAGIIMEHINGLVIDNVNMRWSDDSLRQWNDPLDFRSATVNNISLLNFHSNLYKQ
ncbi:hypothetical protein ACFX15_000975 [Malus domestica]